uniref:tetratricopeptide repeat protein n=1 Tax=Desulfobacter vibrioformis TaxID=34031 RepID=UPI000A00E80E
GVYLYQAAACYYFNADYPNALDTFNRLLKNHPADVTLEKKEVLVNILFALKKNRQALPYLKELAAKSKGDKKRTWQEVLLYQYMELGMDELAVSYARTLTRQEPEAPKWWRALANIHLNKNCLEKGLEAFMIYSFTTPLSASETKLLADLYAGCNIPLEAARVYEAWLKKVQKDPEGLSGAGRKKMTDHILALARAYQQGRDCQAALKWADKGLAQGGDARLLAFKADLLFREKQYKAAYIAYKELAGLGSSPGRSWLMAGYAALSSDAPQKAKQAFSLACKSPREKPAALAALGQIRAMQAAGEH